MALEKMVDCSDDRGVVEEYMGGAMEAVENTDDSVDD